jgi:hypothetical protein
MCLTVVAAINSYPIATMILLVIELHLLAGRVSHLEA